MAPSGGFAASVIYPYQQDINSNPAFKDLSVGYGSFVFGANYQYKYPMRKILNPYVFYFGCINVRYSMGWHLTQNELFKGFTHYITISWGYEMRGSKRVD